MRAPAIAPWKPNSARQQWWPLTRADTRHREARAALAGSPCTGIPVPFPCVWRTGCRPGPACAGALRGTTGLRMAVRAGPCIRARLSESHRSTAATRLQRLRPISHWAQSHIKPFTPRTTACISVLQVCERTTARSGASAASGPDNMAASPPYGDPTPCAFWRGT